ncbi:ATP-binding cassette domain-containing protein [Ectothiorhodospiraceae bacterium 2226]|nr:ATP-binding cassette domain-containing protein [Ectothiorhodospiraceae bacterium 2226]
MIELDDLTLLRGGRPLLQHAAARIHAGQKVGLIGPNGCGKSTLFALLRGQLTADGGSVRLPREWTIAHVAQETPSAPESALTYALEGDGELAAIQRRLAAAEAANDGHAIAVEHAALGAVDGYTAPSRAARLLVGLGFAQADMDRPVREFSGGWRVRLNLARALMCRSDLLLLDEPTNHLDLDAVVWLEGWLRAYPGTLMLISHDRDFLDNVVDHVVHFEDTALVTYRGGYSDFERQRAERLAQQQAAYDKQQAAIAHMQSFVNRFRAKATKARQAQSRLKALERMEQVAAVRATSPFRFEFPPAPNYPNPLLKLEKAQAGYGDSPVLRSVDLLISPGDRIGLVGANGAGKSTLIKLLADELAPRGGARLPSNGLRVGYFAQHQMERLDPEASPLLHLARLAPEAREQALRNFLGGFGFAGDDALRAVAPFSGGEKARLALALLVWSRPNLLLLDEPTNHLDLDMREALVDALLGYEGALVVVSHDRHLLRTSTDRLLLVADGAVAPFDGDLDDYAAWLGRRNAEQPATDAPAKPAPAPRRASSRDRRPLERRLAQLERSIEKLEAEKAEIEARLADAGLYDPQQKEALAEALRTQAHIAKQLGEAEAQWLELSETLEAMS